MWVLANMIGCFFKDKYFLDVEDHINYLMEQYDFSIHKIY